MTQTDENIIEGSLCMGKERQSNFEILRIIAMILIVAGHFAYQTGAMEQTTGMNYVFTLFWGSANRIAVNLFLMLGTWFMVNNNFKAISVVSLYSETWFYSVILTIVAIAINPLVSKLEIIKSFFPFVRLSLWFVTVYIELLLLAPFLKKAFSLCEKSLKSLIILVGAMVVGMSTIHGFIDTFLCALIYFIFIYLFMGYYKMYLFGKYPFKAGLLLACSVSLYLIAIALKYIFITHTEIWGGAMVIKIISQYLSDYKSLPNFIVSLLIFTAFIKMDMGSSEVINRIAKSAFGVYVIHQVPAFHDVIWFEIFQVNRWMNSSYFIFLYIVTCVSIYVLAMLIDEIRRATIEKWWLHTSIVEKTCRFFDSFYCGLK